MVKVRVPATSANMGSGFDSIGVALTLYNYVTAKEEGEGLRIDIPGETGKFLAKNERNLVYTSMKTVFDQVGYQPKGLHLVLENNIMVTRGLGSSSAGIVSGLMAANALSGNQLSKEELLTMAVELEGHGDNVTPAILGGFTTSVKDGNSIRYVKTEVNDDLYFIAFVPDFYLQTKKARGVLPRMIPMRDAVYNTGRSALLAASFMSGKYENLRTAVGDRLHQKYRKRLIPNMDCLFSACYEQRALGVYLSGAGPTVIAMVEKDNVENFAKEMQCFLNSSMRNWKMHILQADNTGAVICES